MWDINHVLDKVYIGGIFALAEQGTLKKAGIASILKLTHAQPSAVDGFTILELAFPDGTPVPEDYLRRGLDFVHAQVSQGDGTLIMCAAGVSRSATFTLAYLVERGYDLHDAFNHLRQCRPIIAPHPILWMSLLQFLNWPYDLNEALSWL